MFVERSQRSLAKKEKVVGEYTSTKAQHHIKKHKRTHREKPRGNEEHGAE
jgi:hypothetical protein